MLRRRRGWGWWVAAAFVLLAALRMLERGAPFTWWASPWLSILALSVPLFALLFLRPYNATSASRWRRAFIPPLAFTGAALLAIAYDVMMTSPRPFDSGPLLKFAEHTFDFVTAHLAHAPTWAALIVLMDTLRRGALSDRDRVLRLGIAASTLLLLPSLIRGSFVWACYSPVVSAEAARFNASALLPFAFACHAATAISLAVALLPWRTHASRHALLPLFGLLAWSISSLGVDAATSAALALLEPATSEVPHIPDAASMARCALAADVVGGAGIVLALALFTYAAAHRFVRAPISVGVGWRAFASLAPLFVLFTSLGLAPETYSSSPQQHPDAIWDEVNDFQPLTRPGHDGGVPVHLTGVIGIEGNLVVHLRGAVATVSGLELLQPSPHQQERLVLVPDARATLASLQFASFSLRMFSGIALAWRFENLDQAERARARWPFVEMSNRALRSRYVTFVDDPLTCPDGPDVIYAGAHFRRCSMQRTDDSAESVLVIENRDEVLLSAWLDATEGVDERFVIRVHREVGSDWERDAHFRPQAPARGSVFRSSEPWPAFPIGLVVGTLSVMRARRRALPDESAMQFLRALRRLFPRWRDGIARWLLLFVVMSGVAWAIHLRLSQQ